MSNPLCPVLPVISLSEEDKEDLKEWGNNISLIMALKETPRITRLGNNPFLLTGHIRDNGSIYRIEIGAFYYNGRMRKALIKADKKVLDSIR
ncbi:MAG TPA: hypothetical protein ENG87_00550 [Candidatus Pacearchaeota archaeon]|nr:hypothetical protein [Candidatus Pacearchaeota archaeon]